MIIIIFVLFIAILYLINKFNTYESSYQTVNKTDQSSEN